MLWQELKKIWRPGRVLLLAVLGFVYYTLFLEFYIQYFPNGPQYDGLFRVAKEWVGRYGTSLDPAEEAQAAASLPALREEAAGYLAQNGLARQYGLATWEEYEGFLGRYVYSVAGSLSEEESAFYADAMRLQNYMQSEETANVEGRIYAVGLYTQMYELWRENGPAWQTKAYQEGYTPREIDHAARTFFGPDEAWQNILPAELPEMTAEYAGRVLIWLALACCLLLAPLLTGDRMSRARALQWSSRRGRGVLKVQLRACLLSGALLWAASLLVFGGLFAGHGLGPFVPCRLFSFMNTGFCWPDTTYGLWCALLALMALAFVLGLSALLFWLSGFSAHYVALLLKVIPCFGVAAFLIPKMMNWTFYYANPLYQATRLPGVEAALALAALAGGLALAAAWRRKTAKQDLAN